MLGNDFELSKLKYEYHLASKRYQYTCNIAVPENPAKPAVVTLSHLKFTIKICRYILIILYITNK